MELRELTALAYKCGGWHTYPQEEPVPGDEIIYQDSNGNCGYGYHLGPHGTAVFIWKSISNIPFRYHKNMDTIAEWFRHEATVNPRVLAKESDCY